MATQTKVWVLAVPPTGDPDAKTFRLETKPIPELQDGQVLIKVAFLSNDPVFRTMINPVKAPAKAPINVGDKMIATGIGKVVQSKSPKWNVGDDVFGPVGWTEYAVLPGAALTAAVNVPGKEAALISVLGGTTNTAYTGIFDVLKPTSAHTVLITGASGAVGSYAVQFAKNVCGAKRVVGIAGSEEKCRWVESLGADKCVNYKSPSFAADLAAAAPDGVDRSIEGTGGQVFNTYLPLLAEKAVVAFCGMIASYNGEPTNWTNFLSIVRTHATIQGFTGDWASQPERVAETSGNISKWINEGKIKIDDVENLVPAKFEDIPAIWGQLFNGQKTKVGKLVTKL